ncbi:head maturation protease, ClpP-related [Pectinatus haikarae]|uniref:head maturation protease, ClpP-related n=1 Tax=Pectinatus haikarae TaxID=349096 RepID=UPI0018C76068|nr:head maturation protease, ClpP-related [Pectinatus haikarae]
MKFWNFKPVDGGAELRIDGDIVDDNAIWMYEWFGIKAASPNTFRDELNKYSGQNITVWIDSYGGDVTAGAGIYNALKSHNGKVTTVIDGKAMSAASVIAMAGDTVQMSPVGILMIHNPWSEVSGEAKDIRKVADVLDTVKTTIMNAYQQKTGKSVDEISQMMDDETYMDAQKAKNLGFIDEILYQDEGQKPPIQNSLMFTRFAIQNSGNADSFKKFIEKNKKKLIENKEELPLEENKINTLEDLQKAYPDLYGQIAQNSIENERGRISALEKMDDPQNEALHAIIVDAKSSGKSEKDIKYVVDILNKYPAAKESEYQKNDGKDFMKDVIEDNKKSGVDNIASNGKSKIENEETERKNAVKFMVEAINKRNGVKK